jgi:hypothetical protein
VPIWHRFFYRIFDIQSVMNKISALIATCCFLFAAPAQSASFIADAVQIRGDNVSHAKMYWLDGNVRFEYQEDDVPMVQIFDNKNNKVIWLDTRNKYYVEQDMSADDRVHAGNKSKKTDDPCKQFVGGECTFLKKAEMNGRAAEKWLITLNDNGHEFHIFQWIDNEYKNILRQENSDGTSLNVFIEDGQKMNGRDVRKLTMIAYSAAGERKQGVQWYDNELDIVVKQEYQDGIVDELRNIDIGDISKKLFLIPDGYTVFDDAAMAKMQAARAEADKKNTGSLTAEKADER